MHESYFVTERFFLGEKGREGGAIVSKLQLILFIYFLIELLNFYFDRAQLNLQKL